MDQMHVFTYGTLMFSEVWRAVIGRRYRQSKAVVDGFQRHAVLGVDYPCLIRSEPDQQVDGILYFDIKRDDLETLDNFEADQYDREVIPCTLANGEIVEAFAYLWSERHMDQVGEDWDIEGFRDEGMRRFLARHGDW